MLRLHVVGLPFEPRPDCAYHGKVVRFVAMMRARGHTVFEYQATPDEWDADRVFDPASPNWQAMNARVALLMSRQLEPHDIICVIAGRCQQQLAEAFPQHHTVEFGVGYGGTFAQYRVFESYAWMHTVYGAQSGGDAHSIDGRFYDAVIPNYYDPADFPAGEGGGGFAYVGRLIDRKGVQVAADVCERLGARLTLAGDGDAPAYGDYVGVVGPAQRAKIMGEAQALFVPTLYVEPFGGVAAEAMLCGTPVITTDFGAFTETVVHGVTGYRCRTMGEFQWAARHAHTLDRDAIRRHALERWTYDAVAPRYEAFFGRLGGLWGDGFYESDDRVP